MKDSAMILFRRRNYFIKKGFQGRFMLRFIAASFAVTLLAIALFISLARNKIDDILFSMRLPVSGASALLSREALYVSIAAVAAISILYLLAARSMYRKIEGPLQRIKTDLRRITSGDLGCRVTLREEDEFKDFAGEINAMAEALGLCYAHLRNRADELAATVKALESVPGPDESQALMQRLSVDVRALRKQIGDMKL
jgi:methyl-accepting chemotaxis protein